MNCNFDELIDRRGTNSAKWRHYDADVLPMWVADMDFPSAEPIVEALKQRVEHRIFGYPCDLAELDEAVVNWLETRHGWKVKTEDILYVSGVVSGFNLVSQAVTRPGDGVLLQTPAYPPFFGVSGNASLLQQESALVRSQNGLYEIDFDDLEKKITSETRVLMLCNPHNPTGRVFSKQELEKLAEVCLRHNILICSDEIHHDLVYAGSKHIPIASLSPEIARNTVTLLAPSKTFNIAGLEASVIVCTDAELRQKIDGARRGLMSNVNALAQVAALAAYREGAEWLDDVLLYLEGNRDLVYDTVKNEMPGVAMDKPQGTYLAWLDCRGLGLEQAPSEFFLEKARVGLNNGSMFGKEGEGFVRMNFGCPRSLLEDGLSRMINAIAQQREEIPA
jgi:cystathionine beta-lyase